MASLTPLSAGAFAKLAADTGQTANLGGLLKGREFDDILVAAQGPYLALLDAHASAIPLCRTMARTRNSVLLQKAQFRTWIARGIVAGQSVGAGHIRRSEEHTSELQSLMRISYAVFCLKKKNNRIRANNPD